MIDVSRSHLHTIQRLSALSDQFVPRCGDATIDAPTGTPVKLGLIGALVFFCVIALFHGQTYERLYSSGQHDLRAFLACAHDMIAGRHIYVTRNRVVTEDPTLNKRVPPFVYPPLLGIIMIPATVVSYDTFTHIWFFLNFFFVLHGIFLAVSILPFGSNRSIAFLLVGGVMLGSHMFHWLLHAAQVDAFTIWLSTFSLWLFGKKKWLASAAFICVAAWIKVTPGLFFLYLLIRGPRRFGMCAIGFGLALGLAQFVAFPGDFLYYFHETLFQKMPTPTRAPIMQSLWSISNLIVVPGNGTEIFNAPTLFHRLLLVMKMVVVFFAIAVLIRKREGATGLFLGFAVCSSVSVLLTDMSWMMRFVWNYISMTAILYVISGLVKRWQRALLIPFGVLLILLNLEFVWKGAFGELRDWKAIFIAGPGLFALLSTIFLGSFYVVRSEWAPPFQSVLKIIKKNFKLGQI